MTQPSDPQATKPSTSASSLSALRLRFRGGQHHGKVVRVSSSKCTIGAAENATLRLSCPGVHAIHCLILRGEAGTVVRRMSADTLVNNKEFEDTRLEAGDVLSIGPIEFEILDDVVEGRADLVSKQSGARPQNAELNQQREQLDEQERKLEEQAAQLGEQRSELEVTRSQLQQQQQEWRTLHDAEESRLQDWATQLGEFEQSLNAVQSTSNQEAQEKFQQQLEALESTNQQLVERLEKLQAENDEAKAQWEQEKAAKEAESNQLSEQAAQLETLQAKLAELEQEKSSQGEDQIASLQAELESKQELQSNYDQLVREVETMRHQMDQAEEYCNKWEAQQQQMESDLEAANMANDEKDNELNALRAKLAGQNPEDLASQPVSPVTAPIYEAPSQEPAVYDQGYVPEQNQAYAEQNTQQPSADAFVPPTQTMTMDEFSAIDESPADAPIPSRGSETMIFSETGGFEETEAESTSPESAMDMLNRLRDDLGVRAQPESGEGQEAYADPSELTYADPTATQSYAEPEQSYAEPEQSYAEPEQSYAEPEQSYAKPEQSYAEPAYENPVTPQSPDEVTYSQPEAVAPIDTASILAQYGHTMEAGDQSEPQPAPEPEPMVTMAAEEPAPTAEATGGQDDIQDYMAQLMKRVGGDDYQAPPAEPSKSEPSPTIAMPEKPAASSSGHAGSTPKPAPEKLLDPSEFVPRAVAPEATGGLKALRAVANTSTRSAIDRHQKRRLDSKALISLALGLVAAIVCLATGYLSISSGRIVSLTMLTCMVSGFVALLALIKALAFSARKFGQSRRQQNLKQLSAR